MKTSIAIFLVCGFLFSALPLYSQSIPRTVIGSNGDHSHNYPGLLHWTVGESIIDYLKSGATLSTGFHQGSLTFPTSTKKKVPISGIEIYPNPFFEEFVVRGVVEKVSIIRVIDVTGLEISRLNQIPAEGKIFLRGKPSGTYFLEITQENGEVHLEKLIKIQ